MPSQFFGLDISYTGLTTANAALNTTANNIANVETDGYSRQKAIQQANRALRTFTTYGCAGAGVDTIAIERMRDEFYDTKFWDNSEKLGEQTAKAYYMETIENYFMDTDSVAGFNTAFNLMYDALEELSKNAGDKATKAQFITYAQSLCDYFNNLSTELSELQKDVNMEIKDTVSQINSISEQIATLNKQINVIELTGSHANELRDKRALLLDELSSYISVETKETPLEDLNHNFQTGANRFQVFVAGGQTLVDTNDYFTLDCIPRETNETVNQSDVLGLYDLRWSTGIDFNLYSANLGGKLQGLVEMRDGNNTEYFHGNVEKVFLEDNAVLVSVNLDYLKDLDKCILPAQGGNIMLGNEEYYFTDWTMTYDADKEPAEVTYRFELDKEFGDCVLSNSRLNLEAKVGRSIDYQGIPYYQEQLNEFVRNYARHFNQYLTENSDATGEAAIDGNGNPATYLFKATGSVTVDQYELQGAYKVSSGTVSVTNSDDTYYKLTAANFAISDYIYEDADRLATRTGLNDGESKCDIVMKLLQMKTDQSMMEFRGGSASEFLQSVLSDVALNGARANSSKSYYNTMEDTIDNQRLSVSGVDSDEEAVSLVKYQNAYNLASKMIQTFTEIYDRLILETGV